MRSYLNETINRRKECCYSTCCSSSNSLIVVITLSSSSSSSMSNYLRRKLIRCLSLITCHIQMSSFSAFLLVTFSLSLSLSLLPPNYSPKRRFFTRDRRKKTRERTPNYRWAEQMPKWRNSVALRSIRTHFCFSSLMCVGSYNDHW